MKTKKYFGEKPLEAPVPFGSMYKNKRTNHSSDIKSKEHKNYYYPSPEQLAEYDRICEGSSSKIIAMLDKDQMNRHALSQKSLRARILSQRLAMFLSAIVITIIATISGYLALKGFEIQSIILSVAAVVGIVYVYKYNKNKLQRDHRPFNRNRFNKKQK